MFANKIFFLALLQLGISLILSVLMAYSTFNIFRYFLVKRYKIQLNNTAFAILSASVLLAVAHIVSGILNPLLNVIRNLSENTNNNAYWLLQSASYGLLFLGTGFLIAFVVIITGLYLFTLLTYNIHEFEEIGKDNKAVGILTGVIIIVIAIFVKDSAVLLLESLIPYPNFPFRN